MGAVVLRIESLINTILDVVVIKTGIVISDRQLVEILSNEFPYSDNFKDYEKNKGHVVRIRSEEFDGFCFSARKSLGELDKDFAPFFSWNVDKYSEWIESGYDPLKVHKRFFELMAEVHNPDQPSLIDPTPIVDQIIKEKIAPLEIILDVLQSILHTQKASNTVLPAEEILWDGGIPLNDLFAKEHIPLSEQAFIDQKYINYLEAHPEQLEYMHWRNFERLTAEFFKRDGYDVVLGPGSNDGGVDLRIYDEKDTSRPLILIQCKRHKSGNDVKIETVKSFYSDIEFEGANAGMIATTSKIVPGGKKVVAIRKYPLSFAENEEIRDWVARMKKR